MRVGCAATIAGAALSDWETFKQYNSLADQLLAAATHDQLAECARILALNVAHYKARFGEAPTDDITETLRADSVDEGTAAMLASGMENLCGVLGTVMGLDAPSKLN